MKLNANVFRKGDCMYNNLKAEMGRANMTGASMADVLDITPQAFYSKLHGKSDWTLKQMKTVQHILTGILNRELSLEYLFDKGV